MNLEVWDRKTNYPIFQLSMETQEWSSLLNYSPDKVDKILELAKEVFMRMNLDEDEIEGKLNDIRFGDDK